LAWHATEATKVASLLNRYKVLHGMERDNVHAVRSLQAESVVQDYKS
jgi:hypothetical protein